MAESEKDFLQWKVKPIWKISSPSKRVLNTVTPLTQIIYGVDRGSLDISRNWIKIHSVERFNQGFVEQPTDFRITIAVKEHGDAYEFLRRLGIGGVLFDLECDVLRKTSDEAYGDLENEYGETYSDYTPWMKGFEVYEGCIIQREGQTIDVGAFPVREFEIEFLKHTIKKVENQGADEWNTGGDISEGDGTYATLSELGLE